MAASAIGTLLDTTFGVQRRASVKNQGPVIVRTSPSGGSRHPIEAYLLAWNYYSADLGALTQVLVGVIGGVIVYAVALRLGLLGAGPRLGLGHPHDAASRQPPPRAL